MPADSGGPADPIDGARRNGRPLRVAVFAPFAKVTPHFETDLEILQSHLDAGDEVTLLRCDADLPACAINQEHDLDVCVECMACRWRGERLLKGPVRSVPPLQLMAGDRVELGRLETEFRDLDELKAYRIGDFDLGYAALSTLVTNTRNPAPDLEEHAGLLRRLIQAAFIVYRSLGGYLDRHPTDRVYVFNGRFAVLRAAVRACQSRGVECYTHDRGRDVNHYELYRNTLPVDPVYVQRRIHESWSAAGDTEDRTRTAARFYEERAQGIDRRWLAHAASMRDGLMPEGWDPERRNIVVFTSSEDEVVSIGEAWRNPLYDTQLEGLRRIVESLDPEDDISLWIRVHPNLKNVKDPDMPALRGIMELNGGPVRVIAPGSPINSYALMHAADAVLGFGSTVGIEAVYWGIPSILAGPSFYRDLGGNYTPSTHEELMRMLRSDLEPKDPEPALMYGYYCATMGRPYRYFRGTGLVEGTFKGRTIRPGPLARLAMNVLRRWRFRHRYLERLRDRW